MKNLDWSNRQEALEESFIFSDLSGSGTIETNNILKLDQQIQENDSLFQNIMMSQWYSSSNSEAGGSWGSAPIINAAEMPQFSTHEVNRPDHYKFHTTPQNSLMKFQQTNFEQMNHNATFPAGLWDFSSIMPKPKKPRLEKRPISSLNISFQQSVISSASSAEANESDSEAIARVKEMIYHAAAFRPVTLDTTVVLEKPKRKNVRISSDPQTVAARQRRERISERIRLLQDLVPGGSKMDTATMLDEAANYLKFLRSHVKALQSLSTVNLSFSPCTMQQPHFWIHDPKS